MSWRERLAVIGLVAGVTAGLASGVGMVGRPARLPGILALFCSGFAGGASVVALRARRLGSDGRGSESSSLAASDGAPGQADTSSPGDGA